MFIVIFSVILWTLKESFKNKKVLYIFAEFILAILLSIFIVQFIKINYPHIRPISYFYPGEQLFDSFPSQHATIMSAISIVILNNFLEWGILLYLLTVIVSLLSWISLMHWPIDIIVGLFLGFLIGSFAREFIKMFLRLNRK